MYVESSNCSLKRRNGRLAGFISDKDISVAASAPAGAGGRFFVVRRGRAGAEVMGSDSLTRGNALNLG